MTGVQTCALPICFPVTIGELREAKKIKDLDERLNAEFAINEETRANMTVRLLMLMAYLNI